MRGARPPRVALQPADRVPVDDRDLLPADSTAGCTPKGRLTRWDLMHYADRFNPTGSRERAAAVGELLAVGEQELAAGGGGIELEAGPEAPAAEPVDVEELDAAGVEHRQLDPAVV